MNAVIGGLVLFLTCVAVSKATFEQKILSSDWSEDNNVRYEPVLSKDEDPTQIAPGTLDIEGNVFDKQRMTGHVLKVLNGGKWGTWGKASFCPPGSYAAGYNMKIEPEQGRGDDTSLNAIEIICKNQDGHVRGEAKSKVGPYGHWKGSIFCKEDCQFLTSFDLQVEPDQGHFKDDTAANYVKFTCRCLDKSNKHKYELVKPPGRGFYGDWGLWSESCETGSAICGIKTKVEGKRYWRDDTALNDVIFFCCK